MEQTEQQKPKSDLKVRVLSAIVMVAVAGGAFWAAGWVWILFVFCIAAGVIWEWQLLVKGFAETSRQFVVWNLAGLIYIAVACVMLILLRRGSEGEYPVLSIVGAVIGTDVGAYFAGRAIGGPKIAPSISPSKTWAGLFGGMIGAATVLVLVSWLWTNGMCRMMYPLEIVSGFGPLDGPCDGTFRPPSTYFLLMAGPVLAIIAQSGDFFESWMKRRAGVKDSGKLIPGHGGLFDRVDGLLAVSFSWPFLVLFSLAISTVFGK